MRLNLRRIFPLALAMIALSIVWLSPLIVSAASYPMTSSDTEISKALDYLKSQQGANGGIVDMATTSWATMAVAAAGEDPNGWKKDGNSLVDYMKNNLDALDSEFNVPAAYSRTILAVIAAEEDPYNFGGVDLVAKLKTFYDGTQIGDAGLLNDDYWGILALVAAGESPDSTIVQQSKLYILKYQQGDNGWAYDTTATWGTDVDSTAEAIMALIAAGESPDLSAITKGMDYIKAKQGSDGGFQSWGASNADTTSRGINAILSVGQDPASEQWEKDGKSPVDFLLERQVDDGSFEWQPGNPGALPIGTTSNAVVALVGKPYPVKTVSVVTIDERISSLEEKISTLEDKAGTLEAGASELENKVNTLEDENDTLVNRFWIAIGVGGLGLILGIVGLVRRHS